MTGTVAVNVGFYGKGDTQRMLIAVNDTLPWHWDCMFTFYAYLTPSAAGFPLDTIHYCRNGERFARSAFLAEEWTQVCDMTYDSSGDVMSESTCSGLSLCTAECESIRGWQTVSRVPCVDSRRGGVCVLY